MLRPVTRSWRDAISGHSSTPMASDLACTKGVRLYAGSSAIARSLAVTEPERIESFSSPSFTSRPSACVSRDSSIGRNRLGSIAKGSASTASSSSTMTEPAMRATRFISV